MDPQIAFLLSSVAGRFQKVRFAQLLALGWILVAASAIALSQLEALPKLSLWLFLGALGAIACVWLGCKFAYGDRRWIANSIEEKFPSLKQRLVTAIQPAQPSTSSFLRRSLVDETISHSRLNDWRQTVATSSIVGAWMSQFAALTLAAVTGFYVYSNESVHRSTNLKTAGLITDSDEITVEPGDVDAERGSDVVVSVRYSKDVPDESWIETECKTGEKARHPMQRSLKDPLFGGYLRNLQVDQGYRINYLSGSSPTFKIKVFDYPALMQSDAKIESPDYSKLATKEIADTRRVSVVDGASLTWKCKLNKSVSVAELVDQAGNATPLVPSQEDPLQFEASFVMTESQRWKIRLVDKDQRASKFEEELSAKVIPNQPPETKLVKAQDQSVSPLQELQMRATAKDDFGIERSGLTFVLGEAEPTDVIIPADDAKLGKVELSYLIDLESLQAKPDQLLSYYFWAEDIDRDGEIRRVDGDMFFAEIRPFEEIFREGESMSKEQQKQQQEQQQQQSEGAKKAEELAELQKQIISGTWNVIRREKPKSISKTFMEDTKVLMESQLEALGMTDKLAEKIADAQSEKFLEQVRDAMTMAKDLLGNSSIDSDLLALRGALRKEREAYEGLLRLRAREHQIVQSQQQQQKSSKSSSQQNRQQQIDQLKLEDNENRYEAEQKADAAEPTAERETRQVMNRLAELAKRQSDLNEQIKNLETAVQEAKSEEAKKELEEQLKRLRENQEELLRDSDEVLERMNQPENRQAMQEAREQMEQARSDMQKSAQSLNKGETAPALSAGTRAQRQMDETKEQLRQTSSTQLEQTMRDLVQDAKRLEEQQKKLDQKVSAANRTPDPKASDTNSEPANESASPLRPEGELKAETSNRKDWQEQKKELKALLEKMQQTVSEAESSEPLLAEKLYETFRESKQKGLEQRMDEIPILVERGLEEPARRKSNELNEGIRTLKENIEKASEDVLGSEEQSLRRALAELERAQRQLNSELNARDPKPNSADGASRELPSDQQPTDGASSGLPSDQQTTDGASRRLPSGQQPADGASRGLPSGQQPADGASRGLPSGPNRGGALQRMSPGNNEYGPLTGNDYSTWVDSLRDVEELVSDPSMRGEVVRIREAAREMRVDYKRHSKEPQWSLVRKLIAEPIAQLREKVQEELLRKSSERNAIVPIDHDPVPSKYQLQQDRYYENLGGAKNR